MQRTTFAVHDLFKWNVRDWDVLVQTYGGTY